LQGPGRAEEEEISNPDTITKKNHTRSSARKNIKARKIPFAEIHKHCQESARCGVVHCFESESCQNQIQC
jgi:hypothetical protein